MTIVMESVLQGTRESGVTLVLSTRRKAVHRIFTIEATAIEFFGGIIGVTFGSIFVIVAKSVIAKVAKPDSLTGATFTVPHG